MRGFISLHRKIMDNPVFNDLELYRLWSICLLKASYKENEVLVGRQIVKLNKGQFVTGRFDLHALYNRGLKKSQQKSDRSVWRLLNVLQDGGYLTIKSTNKYSVVTIDNWEKYQFPNDDIDQQSDQQHDQQKGQQPGQSVTTNNKDNKTINKNKELYIAQFDEFWKLYPQKKGKAKAKEKFLKLAPKFNFEEVMRGTRNYIAYCQTNNRYFKDGSTFVNQQAWNDYLDEDSQKGGQNRGIQKSGVGHIGRPQYGPGSGNEHPATAGRVGRIRSERLPDSGQAEIDIGDDDIF